VRSFAMTLAHKRSREALKRGAALPA